MFAHIIAGLLGAALAELLLDVAIIALVIYGGYRLVQKPKVQAWIRRKWR